MIIDEIEYTVINDHTGDSIPVVGFKTACEEAYAQSLWSPSGHSVKVVENAAESVVATYTRDSITIDRT